MNRFLKYVNILIILLAVGAAARVWWFACRPLPKTSGNLSAPISADAVVERTERGVPHIRAGSIEDALFLQGFVTAQDRMFQMDLARRKAAGELAEIFGPGAVASDLSARTLRMRQLAELHYRELSLDQRRVFDAYARGVNFYLESNRDRMPLEFTALHYDPRPWTPADSILVVMQMFRLLSSTWGEEIQKQTYLETGDATKVKELFPLRTGFEVYPGSNAWAVGGSLTATGKPILSNDTHLPFEVPGFWFQIALAAEDLDVAGFSVPGLPGVISGHNRHIAWGVTNLRFDIEDLYAERLNPATGQYVHQGEILQATRVHELIAVRGAGPVPVTFWVTHHGPVVISKGELQVALRWSAAEKGFFSFPVIELNRAANWDQFRAALSGLCGPAQNFVYADTEGNIGYQATGRFPIRRTFTGDVPVDGSSGRFEWDGFIPYAGLPSYKNPPSGIIVSANQNPFPKNYAYPVNGMFAPAYRSRRVRRLLAENRQWDAAGMLSVQTDTYDAFRHYLAGELAAAYERRGISGSELGDIVGQLKQWDGKMDKNLTAPFVASLLAQHLRRAIAERAAANAALSYQNEIAPAVIERLIKDRPADWFEDYDQLLLRSFVDAVEEARRMMGEDSDQWKYGSYNLVRLPNSILDNQPYVGKYLARKPEPMSGSPNSVNAISRTHGPSMRMTLDLGGWENSLANLVLGQSGHYFSPHYADQWDAYRNGTSFPMQFSEIHVQDRLSVSSER